VITVWVGSIVTVSGATAGGRSAAAALAGVARPTSAGAEERQSGERPDENACSPGDRHHSAHAGPRRMNQSGRACVLSTAGVMDTLALTIDISP
jgi:hypothetical protein